MQPLYEELSPCIGDMLRRRRSGVLAALLAACGRANCCQKEACAALAAAISIAPQVAGKTGVCVCVCVCVSMYVCLGCVHTHCCKIICCPYAALAAVSMAPQVAEETDVCVSFCTDVFVFMRVCVQDAAKILCSWDVLAAIIIHTHQVI